jgi:hypothetical protein
VDGDRHPAATPSPVLFTQEKIVISTEAAHGFIVSGAVEKSASHFGQLSTAQKNHPTILTIKYPAHHKQISRVYLGTRIGTVRSSDVESPS